MRDSATGRAMFVRVHPVDVYEIGTSECEFSVSLCITVSA